MRDGEHFVMRPLEDEDKVHDNNVKRLKNSHVLYKNKDVISNKQKGKSISHSNLES